MPVTVRYGDHPDQVADLAFPDAPDPVPLVVFWHGGFWRAEHDRRHVRPAVAALTEAGCAVANVEYRRIGAGGGWPGTLTDAASAADQLPALVEASRPGVVDPDRVVHVGHSAGGHLALWVALRHRIPVGAPGHLPAAPRIAGVVALAPALDLVDAHRLGQGRGAVRDFLAGGPEQHPDRFAVADPAALGAPDVPLVVVHGDRDEALPADAARRYRDRHGVTLLEPADTGHFDLIDPTSAAWPVVRDAVLGVAGPGRIRWSGAAAGSC